MTSQYPPHSGAGATAGPTHPAEEIGPHPFEKRLTRKAESA